MTEKALHVAILLFNDAEVLDFAGPFEVFAVTRRPSDGTRPFYVYTVAETDDTIIARNGLSVNPGYTFASCPPPDLLLVPGGQGARKQLTNTRLIAWIQKQSRAAQHVLSVCTGALLLAKAGLLDGLQVTTYHTAYDSLGELAPGAILCPGQRYADNGKIITSAGISAGIDMSLHVVEKLLGREQARHTARHMEYAWDPDNLSNPA